MKLSKPVKLGLSGLILGLLVFFGYRTYKRRWQMFEDFGNSQWLDGGSELGIRIATPDHSIKAGDIIEIDHNHPERQRETGEFEVDRLANPEWDNTNWIILKTPHRQIENERQMQGRFRFVKKA